MTLFYVLSRNVAKDFFTTQLNDRPNEICSRRSAPRYERANGENNAAV